MRNHIPSSTVAATLAVAALTVIAVAPAANAQTFYSDLASFQAAATTATVYDFEGIAPAGSLTANPAVLTVPAPGRVTFGVTGGIDPSVYAVDSGLSGGTFTLSDGSDSVLAGLPGTSASVTRIDLDNLYNEFAIDYGMEGNLANSFSFALFDGETQVSTAFDAGLADGDRFFGVTSTTAFNNVRVTAADPSGPSRFVVFDNARVGSPIAIVVPEAGSLALLGAGCSVLCVAAIRRRK